MKINPMKEKGSTFSNQLKTYFAVSENYLRTT